MGQQGDGKATEGYISLMRQFRDGELSRAKPQQPQFPGEAYEEAIQNDADRQFGMLAASNDVDLAVELERGARQPVIDPITERQRSYLTSLIVERGGLLESIDVDNLAKWEASRMIDFALKAPVAPRAMPTPPIPAAPVAKTPFIEKGYYAITTSEVTKFYYVSERGNLSIQASDDFHPIHNYETKRQVFELIALDPRGAQELYGQMIGKCGVCGRTLTDEESRALGIGPVCREKGAM